jgi:hypothetical protein
MYITYKLCYFKCKVKWIVLLIKTFNIYIMEFLNIVCCFYLQHRTVMVSYLINFSFNDQLKHLAKLRAVFIFRHFRICMTDCMLQRNYSICI